LVSLHVPLKFSIVPTDIDSSSEQEDEPESQDEEGEDEVDVDGEVDVDAEDVDVEEQDVGEYTEGDDDGMDVDGSVGTAGAGRKMTARQAALANAVDPGHVSLGAFASLLVFRPRAEVCFLKIPTL